MRQTPFPPSPFWLTALLSAIHLLAPLLSGPTALQHNPTHDITNMLGILVLIHCYALVPYRTKGVSRPVILRTTLFCLMRSRRLLIFRGIRSNARTQPSTLTSWGLTENHKTTRCFPLFGAKSRWRSGLIYTFSISIQKKQRPSSTS
ncbi:hypothetical protein B0H63DRAFT_275739 [Podospora didyma]|uniref:Uncharacterized protein n=1 Tax=Podospora didyma TaxID=330526 RepID=A0AAE0N9L0_9PEZI|nr:hypothetical protein B0H63DRAFT_275739 [Podospora didyma]